MATHNAMSTIEKVDGQHWTTVQELWMKKDREQCESWKDEVQNILIFSGLFSAIATAFIIVSQHDLSPDPAQESVELLRQIAAQSTGQHYIAQSGSTTNHAITICVNIFWFLSLVLSLTTALIGIVSLQWIRSHLRNLTDDPESLGLSHIHSLGLQESHIPLIFTSLPVILILGLVLFLIGLVVFLFELSWPVAIPVAIAIGLTFMFLLITTAHPGLQRHPTSLPSNKPNCFPSPYRSPQSLLVLQFVTFLERLWPNNRDLRTRDVRKVDWTSKSRIWLQQRQKDVAEKKKQGDSESKPNGVEELFAYDTIEALLSVKESRSVESEKDRAALAKCLAQVLPIHLDLFQKVDPVDPILADLIPFLPASEFVPSALFLQKDSTREDLNAVALLQIATCKGRPFQSPAVTEACVHATRWLFDRPRAFDSVPDKQPLHLISQLVSHPLHVHEVLIATLTHFFTFATDFWPQDHSINKTTHTSSYTYWFLVLSAGILTKCPLSREMQSRHTYLLAVIATRLGDEKKPKKRDYLFFTASIYASVISRSPLMQSSPFGGDFLRAVRHYHDTLQVDSTHQQLRKAVKANEVSWSDINRAVEALGPSKEFQVDLEVGFVRESGQNCD